MTAQPGPAEQPLCVVFPHPLLGDGRGANKPWLQEVPDPVSKIAWHAWAEVHPDTAGAWGVVSGDNVRLTSAAGSVVARTSGGRASKNVSSSSRSSARSMPAATASTVAGILSPD